MGVYGSRFAGSSGRVDMERLCVRQHRAVENVRKTTRAHLWSGRNSEGGDFSLQVGQRFSYLEGGEFEIDRLTASVSPMSSPRSYYETPRLFGKSLKAARIVVPVSRDGAVAWIAAWFHHAVAYVAIKRMKAHDIRRKELAAKMGISTGYLERILRGEVGLSADKLARLEYVLGPIAVAMPKGPEKEPDHRALLRVREGDTRALNYGGPTDQGGPSGRATPVFDGKRSRRA